MKNQDFCGLMHILKPSVPKKQQKQSKLEKVDKNFKMPRLDDETSTIMPDQIDDTKLETEIDTTVLICL